MRTCMPWGAFLVAWVAMPVFVCGCTQKTFSDCPANRSCPAPEAGGDAADEESILVEPPDAGETAMPDGGPDAPPEAEGCPATDLFCDGACVPDDSHNCGSCGNACGQHTPVCAGTGASSVCVSNCASPTPTPCGGGCVDLNADGKNCGSCGNACTGGATCQGGGCGCPGGTHECNGTCLSNASTASCGTTSCTPCSIPANGAATCSGASCGISCNANFSPCDGACVDETQNGNCGGCGVTCAISCTSSQCIKATGISAGYAHTCAVLSDGTVECWGDNTYGQLGYATTESCGTGPCSASPHAVAGVTGAAAVSAAGYHTCALLTNDKVLCWGLNAYGEIGAPPCDAGSCAVGPVNVAGLPPVSAIAGGYQSTCALISGGMVECWGNGAMGLLGNYFLAGQSSTPVQVSGLTTATAIALGELHACALEADRTVVCWGDNSADELGSPPMHCDMSNDLCSPTPVPVTGLSGVTALASDGGLFTCVQVSGNVECWGYLQTGLGDQAATQESYTPVLVANVGSATGLAVGQTGACALLSGGSAACWGSGPLGDGTTHSSPTPVTVSNLTNATALAVGGHGACALLSTGAVSCWGDNSYGQLGSGTTTASLKPTPVLW